MDFGKFIEWAFYGIVSGAAVFGVNLLAKLHNDFKNLSGQFAVIIEKMVWHEKWLIEIDREIEKLKDK